MKKDEKVYKYRLKHRQVPVNTRTLVYKVPTQINDEYNFIVFYTATDTRKLSIYNQRRIYIVQRGKTHFYTYSIVCACRRDITKKWEK